MKVYPEAYSRELDRLLPQSDAPAPRPQHEYYTLRTNDGKLLAAGVVWKTWLHPSRLRFYIGVEEMYQRRGYGTMVFERMRADHPGAKWQGAADLDNDIAEWWLRGLGFEFLYRSYWLDAMVIDLEETPENRLPIVSVEMLDKERQDRLASMVWTDYVDKHKKIDPLNDAVDGEDFRRVLLEQSDPAASCCLLENGEILAYIICWAADECTNAVRYAGCRLADREKYRCFLLEAVSRMFMEKGGLMMDADSFDEDALMIMRLFGELPEESYDVYVMD